MLEQSSGEAATRKRPGARDERGQGLVEYALIIALVGLASVIALGFLSGKINTIFSKAGNVLNNVTQASGGGTTGGPTPPTGGAITITCSGGDIGGGVCDDQDDIDGATNSWTSGTPILGYTWLWEQNTGTCAVPSGGWINPDSDGGPGDPDPTQSYNAFPNDVGGASDAVRVTVTATNAAGTSAPVVVCFDVLD